MVYCISVQACVVYGCSMVFVCVVCIVWYLRVCMYDCVVMLYGICVQASGCV